MDSYARTAIILVGLSSIAWAANWAQVNGYNRQNFQASKEAPFSRRWGFALATIQKFHPPGIEVPEYEKSMMYIVGGEDYKHSTVSKPPLDSQKNFYIFHYQWAPQESGQYRNDVWRSTGMKFRVVSDYLRRDERNQAAPRFVSDTTWEMRGPEYMLPPKGIDYKEWLCCIPSSSIPCRQPHLCDDAAYAPTELNRRWSPRRNHKAVTVETNDGDTIVVLGGRARALEGLEWRFRMGGLIDNHDTTDVGALVSESVPGNWTNHTLGWRSAASLANVDAHERSIMMSDVWSSQDGEAWTLRHGGCYLEGESNGRYGTPEWRSCSTDDQCHQRRFGDAVCVQGRCQCRYWAPRERFAAAANGRAILLAGGIAYERRSICGPNICGSEQAVLLNDVWLSIDIGRTWQQLTPMAPWKPRVDFAMLFLPILNSYWIFGGLAGGVGEDPDVKEVLGDAWYSNDGVSWALNSSTNPWQPRFGHYVGVEGNRMYMLGGSVSIPVPPKPRMPPPGEQADIAASKVISSVYRPRKEPPRPSLPGEPFSGGQMQTVADVWIFVMAQPTNTSGSDRGYARLGGNVNLVLRHTTNDSAPVPLYTWLRDYDIWPDINDYVTADAPLMAMNMPDETIATLRAYNITSIRELADIQWKTFDAIHVDCSYIALARALRDKCDLKRHPYDGEFMKNVEFRDAGYRHRPSDVQEDESTAVCVGVSVPAADLDVVCRQQWQPRTFVGGVIMDGAVYVIGGYEGVDNWANDVWYRDERNPSTLIALAPRDGSNEVMFRFVCDEPFCIYQYRVFDTASATLIKDWTWVMSEVDMYKINSDKRRTTLQVRAYDPAGNRDTLIEVDRNEYTWTFVPPFPWLALILGLVFLFLLIIALLEAYRRYRRWKALQAYLAAKKKRKLKYRAGGTLAEYEQNLLKQFEPKSPPPVAPEPQDFEVMPKFTFGGAVQDNPAVTTVAPLPVPLPVQASNDQEESESPEAIRRRRRQQFSQDIPAGKPVVVSLLTGQPLDEGQTLDETSGLQVIPGLRVLRPRTEVQPDPVIQLADYSKVRTQDLRVDLQSMARPTRVTAFDSIKTEVSRISMLNATGKLPEMPRRAMPPSPTMARVPRTDSVQSRALQSPGSFVQGRNESAQSRTLMSPGSFVGARSESAQSRAMVSRGSFVSSPGVGRQSPASPPLVRGASGTGLGRTALPPLRNPTIRSPKP